MQDLIDSQAITFDQPALNVKTNLMPTHASPLVSAVKNFSCQELVRKGEQVKTLISILKENLFKHGFLLDHNNVFEETL